MKNKALGFTLMEVLIALAIVSIALTALIKAMGQNITTMNRVKEKTISHWVAMQGIAMVQLGLLQISPSQETTQDTLMLGEHWYWRAQLGTTPQKGVQRITILVSANKNGPFNETLVGFKYSGTKYEQS